MGGGYGRVDILGGGEGNLTDLGRGGGIQDGKIFIRDRFADLTSDVIVNYRFGCRCVSHLVLLHSYYLLMFDVCFKYGTIANAADLQKEHCPSEFCSRSTCHQTLVPAVTMHMVDLASNVRRLTSV